MASVIYTLCDADDDQFDAWLTYDDVTLQILTVDYFNSTTLSGAIDFFKNGNLIDEEILAPTGGATVSQAVKANITMTTVTTKAGPAVGLPKGITCTCRWPA